jgi:hypothetical protein
METSEGHDESIDFLTCESTIACSMQWDPKAMHNRYNRAEHKHSGNENRSPCWLAVPGTAKAAAADGFGDWMHQASAAL